MRKLYTLTCFFALLTGFANGFSQNKTITPEIWQPVPGAEMAPGIVPEHGGPAPYALFDVQFVYDSGDSAGLGGQAGVVYTGTEFWVSRWQSDTILTFNSTGTSTGLFTIPGISGTRAMTFDGTTVYAVNNTNTIYKINPATKTQTGTITVAMTQVRHCTYDPTANSGGGGFWIGNWATDLQQVDLLGNLLNTIPAATHTLTSMYGSAMDTVTSGGPYLWIFHQGGSSQSNIARIQLPSGALTAVAHDVMSDVGPTGGATSGLAGGLFITDALVGGQWSLVGLLQGTPSNLLFAYELNDFVPPAVDASMDTFMLSNGLTQIPLGHASTLTFDGNIRNAGTNSLNTVNFVTTVKQGVSTVFSDTQSSNNLASGSNVNLTSAGWTPSATGTYDCTGEVTLTGQTDLVSANNDLAYTLDITDSTFARDNGVSTGNGYNVGGTDWAWAGSVYSTQVADTLTSVWISLETPVAGDTTYAVVANMDLGAPTNVIASSVEVIIDGATNDYVLIFSGGLALPAGDYLIGVYEGANTSIGLKQSGSVYTPGSNFFYTPTSGWVPSTIATSRFIRPNFGNVTSVGVKDAASTVAVQLFPNPAESSLNLRAAESIIRVRVTNALGETLLEAQPGIAEITLDVSAFPAGIYLINIETLSGSVVKRFSVTK